MNPELIIELAVLAIDAISQMTETKKDDELAAYIREAKEAVMKAKNHALTKRTWEQLKIEKKW